MQPGSIADEIQEQGNVLEQCVKQLESAQATRAMLAGLLKEALQEQVCPAFLSLWLYIILHGNHYLISFFLGVSGSKTGEYSSSIAGKNSLVLA